MTLTVVASNGNEDTEIATITVNPEPTGDTMHIVSVTTQLIKSGGVGTVDATVVVEDQNGNRVDAATVNGTFSDDLSGTDTATTNSNGEAVLTSDSFTTRPTVLGFCVDSITHATLTYDPNANADPTFACEGGGGNASPTAAFTFSVDVLTASFTDASTDTDGTIASWSWDFGDGSISTEQNPSHTYVANGTYTVQLTVTDDQGATGTTSQAVTVNDGSGGDTMHIQSITTVVVKSGGVGNGEATFVVVDDVGSPVSGATVTGVFSGDLSGEDTGVTDANGEVVLISNAVTSRPGTIGICASSVTHATLTYDPAANADPGYDCGTAAVVSSSGMGRDIFQMPQEIPTEYAIGNYPNPFNPTTTIRYDLPEAGHTTLRVYNVLGQEVAVLLDGFKEAGSYQVDFDGQTLSNGLYIYTLETEGYRGSRTMVLMK